MNKKTLIIGASVNPERYSNKAVKSLIKNGFPVCAIGLKEGKIENIDIIVGKPDIKDIHTVSMYISIKHQPDYYDYIISLKPKRIIFNPGTENEFFYNMAQKNNIECIEACTLVLLSTKQF